MTEDTQLEPLPEDWNRALAVVAHPDDIEYGASSAIARWTAQGKHVEYLLITRGQAGIEGMPPGQAGVLREKEERESAAIVGVEGVNFLDYQDGAIEYGLNLRRDIARSIRRSQPDVIISLNFELTWGGHRLNMADHRHVGLATLDAARDAANRWIFRELLAEGLDPWTGVHMVCFSGSPSPTNGVDVTDYLETGIASLKAHAAYLAGLGGDSDPGKFLREAAEATGKRMGVRYATSFEVYHV